jgi:cytochrome c553
MKRLLPSAISFALLLTAVAVTAQEATAPATEPNAAATDTNAVAAPAADAAAPADSSDAAAAPAEPAEVTGDATRGKGLTYTCRGCHGIEGYKNAYPSYHVPRIGGQAQAYLNAALNEYRNGNRKHPTMQAQAQSFSEQDIADIAAYLSSIQ